MANEPLNLTALSQVALDRPTLNLASANLVGKVVPPHLPTPVHPPAPAPPVPAPPAAAPPSPAPAPPPPPPAPSVPAPPADSPFANLPFPAPGDRIKAEDFKALSQSLTILYNMTVLTASLFGYTLADAKAALAGQRYSIQRVISVFGNELANLADTSMDGRKVLQVLTAAPGDARVMVVVTEAVDSRRFAPNLIGLSYADAVSRIQTLLADVTISGAPPSAPQLTGLTLSDAEQNFFK